jgi:preprotein translocase subunit SecF
MATPENQPEPQQNRAQDENHTIIQIIEDMNQNTIFKYRSDMDWYKKYNVWILLGLILLVVSEIGLITWSVTMLFDKVYQTTGAAVITAVISCFALQSPLMKFYARCLESEERTKRILDLQEFEKRRDVVLEMIDKDNNLSKETKEKYKKEIGRAFWREKQLMNIRGYARRLFATECPWSYETEE